MRAGRRACRPQVDADAAEPRAARVRSLLPEDLRDVMCAICHETLGERS